MATLKVTNLDTVYDTYLSPFCCQLDKAGGGGANISRTFTINAGEVDRLTGSLAPLLAAGKISVEVTPTQAEIDSGLLMPPLSVQAGDVAPVAADGAGVSFIVRKAFAAAGPQDLAIWPAGTPKFGTKKFRIVRAWARITTNIGGSVVRFRSRSADGGTLLAEVAAATAGVNQENNSSTATTAVDMTVQPLDGLYLRKTDAGLNGEAFAEVVIE